MKHRIAAVSIAALAIAGTPITAAQAHHPIVAGTVVCNEQTGTFDITWTVGNSERDKAMTYDARRGTTQLGAGEVEPSGSVTIPDLGVGQGTYVLDVAASWPNGVTATRSATVVAEGECEKPPVVPEKPEPVVTVDSSTSLDCDAEVQITTTVTTTTGWVYDEPSNSWFPGEPVSETVVSEQPIEPGVCGEEPEPPVEEPPSTPEVPEQPETPDTPDEPQVPARPEQPRTPVTQRPAPVQPVQVPTSVDAGV